MSFVNQKRKEMKHSISHLIQRTPKKIEISLNGKNIILVGNNGAGKTVFLRKINNALSDIFQSKNILNHDEILAEYEKAQINAELAKGDSRQHVRFRDNSKYFLNELEKRKELDILFSDTASTLLLLNEGGLIFRFFEAYRNYANTDINLLTSIDGLFESFQSQTRFNVNNSTVSNYFEKYLVSMSNYALLEKGAGEELEYRRVTEIIDGIEKDLRDLFDDENLKLIFNRKNLRMQISQKNKNPFGFDVLPSGFSSILAIYSELIMLTELSKNKKSEVRGIVLIDEIDAHLHVSLQKKVFEFFSSSFPNIQFIISTHSPFVVQSVSNAIIYNLSTNEKLEDLSIYSYASIVKGLLGEETNSKILEQDLDELSSLVCEKKFNDRFFTLVSLLQDKIDELDPRAKSILLNARSSLLDWQQESDNV